MNQYFMGTRNISDESVFGNEWILADDDKVRVIAKFLQVNPCLCTDSPFGSQT